MFLGQYESPRRTTSAPTSSPPSSTSSATRFGLKHGHETRPNGALARRVRQPRVLGADLPDVHRLAVSIRWTGSRRLVAAELHDVRHLGAAVDVRGEFQPGSGRPTLSLERDDRPADDQRRAGAQHRPKLPSARSSRPCGRRAPQRPTTSAPSARTRSTTFRPGQWLTFSNNQLADLNARSTCRSSSRPRATSTTRCSTRATCVRPSPT